VRVRIRFRHLLAAAALVVVQSATAQSELPRLIATVGPGFTIELDDAAGRRVDRITAGRYEVLVHDRSPEHNFVLGSKVTGRRYFDSGVEFVGDKTFVVALTPGPHAYACSPHFQTMNGQLTVLAAAPKTLRATLTATGVKLSATRVSPGRYRFVVRDRSATRSFRLLGNGVDRRSGRAFTGTKTWNVQLRAGRYRFGAEPRLAGRLSVG
jgi:hypothetical protein